MTSKKPGWKMDRNLAQGMAAFFSVAIAVSGLMVEARTGKSAKNLPAESPSPTASPSPSPSPSPSMAKNAPSNSGTGLCAEWSTATEGGRLDPKLLSEESGLAVSRAFPVLYHINDSGDGPHFYVTGRDGTGTKKIVVKGGKPVDTEDLALGPCPLGTGKCLAIADIGDNREKRKQIEIVFIEEQNPMPESVEPVLRVPLRYPDRAHNAEAFAVLPNGDFVIITKEVKGLQSEAQPAQVFRLRKARVSAKSDEPALLEKIGEIDIPSIVKDKSYGGRVTGMSVSSDGRRFLLMTYDKVLEFNVDLSAEAFPAKLQEGRDFSIVNVARQLQQESVSYDTNDRDFLYSSEVEEKILGENASAPIMVVKCKK